MILPLITFMELQIRFIELPIKYNHLNFFNENWEYSNVGVYNFKEETKPQKGLRW